MATRNLVIQHARVFDGVRVRPETSLRVRDGLIASLGTDDAEPGDEVVDARGGTLLPGLIDAHTHLLPGALHQALVFGVTTELDMFSKPGLVAELKGKAATDPGMADLRSSGVGATAPGGHPSVMYAPIPYVHGPGDAAAFVTARIAEGADYLKVIHETLDRDTLEALITAAHEQNLLVTVHATRCTAALEAVRAGADVLQHLPMDEVLPTELVREVLARDVFVTPTLATLENVFGGPGGATMIEDPDLGPWLGEHWRTALTQVPSGWADVGYERALTNMRMLIEEGVALLAGTDVPNPGTVHGASLHRELELLVEAGVTPLDALRAATSGPAHVYGLADRGKLAPGMRADLLLVDGDPTKRITDTRRIKGIWRGGVSCDRTAFGGSATEGELVTALRAQAQRVLAAMPQLLREEEVVREDDGALLGYLRPCPDGTWLPCTVFGYPLGEPADRDDALSEVHSRGLASLADRWQLREGDEWYSCTIQEADRVKVRVQVVDFGHPDPFHVVELAAVEAGTRLRP